MNNLRFVSIAFFLSPLAINAGFGFGSAKQPPIKCTLQKTPDPAGCGGTAFTYMLPKGWTTQSSVNWPNPGEPNATIYATTPDHQYAVMRIEHFVSSYSQFGNNAPNGPRTGNFVQGVIIHHASDLLKGLASKLLGSTKAEDIEEVEELNSPVPPGRFTPPDMHDAMTDRARLSEAGLLVLKFKLKGVDMVASLGATVQGSNSVKHQPNRPDQRSSEFGVFSVGPTTVFIYPAETTAKKSREMQVIATSIAATPQFMAYWRKLTARLAGITIGANDYAQKLDAAGFHDRIMSQFHEQMRMKDAYSHAFCNYISSQQDYKDRQGQTVTLPADSRYVYDDGQGTYVLTDNPGVDLRGFGSGDWKEMYKARPGE